MAALLKDGKLDRARRVIGHANALCPEEAHQSWAPELQVLAELGMWGELRTLAERVEAARSASAEAKTAARAALQRADREDRPVEETPEARASADAALATALAAAARAGGEQEAYGLFLEAHARGARNGEVLVRAGLMASRLGRRADAQRLFDRGLVLAERSTGEEAFVAPASTFAVERRNYKDDAVRVAHCGKRLAVAYGGQLLVYERSDLRVERFRWELPNTVWALACTRSGSTLAASLVASGEDEIRLWDLEAGRPLGRIKGATGGPWLGGLSFSTDGTKLATGTGVRDVATLALLVTAPRTTLDVESAALGPDGRYLVEHGFSGTTMPEVVYRGCDPIYLPPPPPGPDTRLWRLTGSRPVLETALFLRLRGPDREPRDEKGCRFFRSVAWSPDGHYLGADGRSLYDVRARRTVVLANRPPPDGRIWSAEPGQPAFSGDGSLYAVAGNGIWDVATRRRLPKLEEQTSVREALAASFSAEGRELLLGGCARAWLSVLPSGERIELARRLPRVNPAAVSPDGSLLAASGAQDDTRVRIWNLQTGRDLRTLDGHTGGVRSVTALAFSEDGRRLATSGEEGTRIWDAVSGRELKRFDEARRIRHLAFCREGRTLLGLGPRAVHLWETESGGALVKEAGRVAARLTYDFSPSRQDVEMALASAGCPPLPKEPEGAFFPSVNAEYYEKNRPLAERRFRRGRVLLQVREGRRGIVISDTPVPDQELLLRAVPDADAGYVLTPTAVDLVGREVETAAAALSCRVGPLVLPFEVCRERFVVPGLLAKFLAGDTSDPIEP